MKRYILLLALGTLLSGCTKEPDRSAGMYIKEDDAFVTLNALGDTGQSSIVSDRQWQVIVPENAVCWLRADPATGHGNAVVTFTGERNFGAMRTAEVVIRASTDYTGMLGASDTVTVNQGAAAREMQSVALTTFGTEVLASPSPVSEYEDWGNQGPGTLLVEYTTDGENVTVATTETPSGGYSNASGGNCLQFTGSGVFTADGIETGQGGEMTVFFVINQSDEEPVDPSAIEVSYKRETDTEWSDLEMVMPANQTGWSVIYGDFSIPQGGAISIRLTAGESCRVDDLSLLLRSDDPADLTFTPYVTTLAIAEEDINIFNAKASMKYLYPSDAVPTIAGCGVAYRKNGDSEWIMVGAETAESDVIHEISLESLSSDTEYEYAGFTLDSEGSYTYGDILHFTTKPYVPPTPMASVDESFDFSTAGVPFRGNQSDWTPWVSTDDNAEGWLTEQSGDKKYLAVTPGTDAVAFQMLPPLNLAESANDMLHVNTYCSEISTNGSGKLEVVVSEDFKGTVADATWTVVADLTPGSGAGLLNTWTDHSIDLGAYSNSTALYAALRAAGSGYGFRMDDVLFGQERKVQFGTPVVTGYLKQDTESTVSIAIPYRFGDGSANGVTLTSASFGDAASLTASLEKGGGDYINSLIYEFTATPDSMEPIELTINYPQGADYTATTVTVDVTDAEGYRVIFDFALLPNVDANGIANCVQEIPAMGTTNAHPGTNRVSFTSDGTASGNELFNITRYEPKTGGSGTFGFSWQKVNLRMLMGRGGNWNSVDSYAVFEIKVSEAVWGGVWISIPLFTAGDTVPWGIQMEIGGQWTDAIEVRKSAEVRSFDMAGHFFIPKEYAVPAGEYVTVKIFTSVNANAFLPTHNDAGVGVATTVLNPRITLRYDPEYVPVP